MHGTEPGKNFALPSLAKLVCFECLCEILYGFNNIISGGGGLFNAGSTIVSKVALCYQTLSAFVDIETNRADHPKVVTAALHCV